MQHFDAETVRARLPWAALVAALADMFRDGCEMPVRHHHEFAVPGEADGTLLLMPAWQTGGLIGVKIVDVVPGNGARGLPAIHGLYVLVSATTGEMLATMDGTELTARRTAAASALASSHLSRPESRRLVMVGTGRLSRELVAAHASVRPIAEVAIWGRDPAKAAAVAADLAACGLHARPATDLAIEVAGADIVSVATLSAEPLVRGAWLSPGTHIDLVGAFKPTMRESDDEVMRRARVFVDTRAGAHKEAGDIVQAVRSGALHPDAIAGDLFDLTRGVSAGRSTTGEITVFKSVGAALEDLAAAGLVWRGRHGQAPPQGGR